MKIQEKVKVKHGPHLYQKTCINSVKHRKSPPKTLKRLQKQDKFCKRKVHEIKTGMSDDFYLNSENILKSKIVVNHLKVNSTVIPTPLIYNLLHEYHNCKGHQGSARTFNMLKHKFWWKGMRLGVKNYITKCITCSINLPNTACYLLHV